MKKILLGAGLIVMLSSSGHAQQHMIAKYWGHYVVGNGNAQGLTLDIFKMEGDIAWGTAVRMASVARPGCNGKYLVTGKLDGDTLVMRSKPEGGPNLDCTMILRMKVQGNKLVGTMNGVPATLRRR